MVDLNYDFSMNRLQNRLATFKDWPFTEETGSSCTAEKVLPLDRRAENKFSFGAKNKFLKMSCLTHLT